MLREFRIFKIFRQSSIVFGIKFAIVMPFEIRRRRLFSGFSSSRFDNGKNAFLLDHNYKK